MIDIMNIERILPGYVFILLQLY